MGYGFDFCDRRKATCGVVGTYPVFALAAIIFAGMPNIDFSPATGASGSYQYHYFRNHWIDSS